MTVILPFSLHFLQSSYRSLSGTLKTISSDGHGHCFWTLPYSLFDVISRSLFRICKHLHFNAFLHAILTGPHLAVVGMEQQSGYVWTPEEGGYAVRSPAEIFIPKNP